MEKQATAAPEVQVHPHGLSHLLYQRLLRTLSKAVAAEISAVSKYYDRLIQWLPMPHDRGELFAYVQCPNKSLAKSAQELPNFKSSSERVAVLLNGNLNTTYDIEGLLGELYPNLSRHCRVFVVCYNSYFGWLFKFLTTVGLRTAPLPVTFITKTDLFNVCKLSNFEVVQTRCIGPFFVRAMGLGVLIEKLFHLVPWLQNFALIQVILLKPRIAAEQKPSLSILIPARNEKGNIEDSLKRLPSFPAPVEVIFIEGNSNDGTWEEIRRVLPLYQSAKFNVSAYQQRGKGKADAVRVGFHKAKNELVTILDADLTMPPELLTRFYEAYCNGHADFINGSRLTYEMEGESMRFLNHLGNIFFAKALSFVLNCRIGDSLCGTKLFPRSDYARFMKWKDDFGDYDPFGDFELLFPAASLGLGIVDVPIRYRARVYGTTNIHRFRDGWKLFKMTFVGFLKLRLQRNFS